MANLSEYLADALVNTVLRGAAFTSPDDVYLSLHTGDPGLNGANEVSGGDYERRISTWAAAANGSSRLSADVTFPEATADWGLVTHWGLWSAQTGGNFLFRGAMFFQTGAYATINTGREFKVVKGSLQVSMYSGGILMPAWGASEENGPTISLPRPKGRIEPWLANDILDAVLRAQVLTSPGTVYLAIVAGNDFRHIAHEPPAPFDLDGLEEIGVDILIPSYSRQTIAFDVPAVGVTQNTADVTFGPDDLLWQRAGDKLFYIFLVDGSDNILMWSGCTGPLFAEKLGGVSESVVYGAGGIEVTFA